MTIPYRLFKELVEEEFQNVNCRCQLNGDQTVCLDFRLNDPWNTPHVMPALNYQQAVSYRDLSLLIIRIRTEIETLEAHPLNWRATA
ncbi:MAG: hypothetical protein GAK45_02465 [Pseudomonas citronellolis]|nr:MAG: hypothetical protein GAK45_02465 [Pseudomonas citronellolis]